MNIIEPTDARTRLLAIIKTLTNRELEEACKIVLYHKDFLSAFGSAGEHHAYPGGLAIHTYEVVEHALNIAQKTPDVDRDVLITAAVFHDFMKVREYVPAMGHLGTKLIQKTQYRRLVRHVAGSHAEFMKAVEHSKTITPDTIMKIEHAMLAHHGRMEWGSPVEPQLVEAYILHFADMLSSQFGIA